MRALGGFMRGGTCFISGDGGGLGAIIRVARALGGFLRGNTCFGNDAQIQAKFKRWGNRSGRPRRDRHAETRQHRHYFKQFSGRDEGGMEKGVTRLAMRVRSPFLRAGHNRVCHNFNYLIM